MQSGTSIRLNWPAGLWIGFMVAASVALSLGFACAAPLAAIGAVSALTLSGRNAVLAAAAAWLANQAAGCLVLGYPLTADCFAWGAVLGFGAVFAMQAARWSAARATGLRTAAPLAAFAAAFAVYEATLFAAALTFLGGTEDFTAAIIGRVLEINVITLLAMLLLNRAGALMHNSKKLEGAGRPGSVYLAKILPSSAR